MLFRVGLTGDLTREEEEPLRRVAAFSEAIENAGAVRQGFMGFAQVLARRVPAGVIPSVDSPNAHALVHRNARPKEYHRRVSPADHGPRNPRGLAPEEVIAVMREFLASREYIEPRAAQDSFVFGEVSNLSFDAHRQEIMRPAVLKGARIRCKLPPGHGSTG